MGLDNFSIERCDWLVPSGPNGKVPPLNPTARKSRFDLLLRLLEWIFSMLVVPLLRRHFYVTEREEAGRGHVYFYRRPIWARYRHHAFIVYRKSMFTKLSKDAQMNPALWPASHQPVVSKPFQTRSNGDVSRSKSAPAGLSGVVDNVCCPGTPSAPTTQVAQLEGFSSTIPSRQKVVSATSSDPLSPIRSHLPRSLTPQLPSPLPSSTSLSSSPSPSTAHTCVSPLARKLGFATLRLVPKKSGRPRFIVNLRRPSTLLTQKFLPYTDPSRPSRPPRGAMKPTGNAEAKGVGIVRSAGSTNTLSSIILPNSMSPHKVAHGDLPQQHGASTTRSAHDLPPPHDQELVHSLSGSAFFTSTLPLVTNSVTANRSTLQTSAASSAHYCVQSADSTHHPTFALAAPRTHLKRSHSDCRSVETHLPRSRRTVQPVPGSITKQLRRESMHTHRPPLTALGVHKIQFEGVNRTLSDVFAVLRHEMERQPNLLGASVFGKDEVYRKLRPFLSMLRNLKGDSERPEKLYAVTMDIQAAFDNIHQRRLMRKVVRPMLSRDSYWVYHYSMRCMSPSGNPMSPRFLRTAFPPSAFPVFPEFVSKRCRPARAVFVDQVHARKPTTASLTALLEEHIYSHVVRIGGEMYTQHSGIPQGSVLSSHLCSLYLGYFERTDLIPALLDRARACHARETASVSNRTVGTPHRKSVSQNGSHEERGGEVGHPLPIRVSLEENRGKGVGRQALGNGEKRYNLIGGECSVQGRKVRREETAIHWRETSESNPAINRKTTSQNSSSVTGSPALKFRSRDHFVLVRMIDDFLLLTRHEEVARTFVDVVRSTLPKYGTKVNDDKTHSNFSLDCCHNGDASASPIKTVGYCGARYGSHGQPRDPRGGKVGPLLLKRKRLETLPDMTTNITDAALLQSARSPSLSNIPYANPSEESSAPPSKRVRTTSVSKSTRKDGTQLEGLQKIIPWCGFVLDTVSLSVQADYSKYAGVHMRDTVTVGLVPNPGQFMRSKVRQAAKVSVHSILFDPALNSTTTLCENIAELAAVVAMKYHCYAKSLPRGPRHNIPFFQRVIRDTCDYIPRIIRNKMRGVTLPLTHKQMVKLCMHSFFCVLERKQSFYGPVVMKGLRGALQAACCERLCLEGKACLLRPDILSLSY
eukprot:Rmarinus@m.28341